MTSDDPVSPIVLEIFDFNNMFEAMAFKVKAE